MTAITLTNVSKTYTSYHSDWDRLVEVITRRSRHREFHALLPMDLNVPKGQVVGIIGRNGAGKSTLLKIIATTLAPTTGEVSVYGRMAGLLELGTGFHPEMTGRESVFLTGAIMGIEQSEMRRLYDRIVAFSEIEAFMDQPVKTYSSGMRVRLAFAVATSVQPDILIIDEHLSVGDGAFARKSFERIRHFKESGRTIFFCSHSMYQVEAICDRAIWLDQGAVRMDGMPSDVVAAYSHFLDQSPSADESDEPGNVIGRSYSGTARIHAVRVAVDGDTDSRLPVSSGESKVQISVEFRSDSRLPAPSVAISFVSQDGRVVTSAGSRNDGVEIQRDPAGNGAILVEFDKFSLLKGTYSLNAYLLCEDGIHLYDQAKGVAELVVTQNGLEQGLVSLPRRWKQTHDDAGMTSKAPVQSVHSA